MEQWYSIIIGATILCYIHSFNRNANLYFQSEKTMSWLDLVKSLV